MFFGQMISDAREESRLSLRELAQRIGASATTLNKIESTGHIPRDYLITRLIQVLRLDEQAVRARITRQRMAQHADEMEIAESETALSPVPVVGKVTDEL